MLFRAVYQVISAQAAPELIALSFHVDATPPSDLLFFASAKKPKEKKGDPLSTKELPACTLLGLQA